jgi:hypothetical protein
MPRYIHVVVGCGQASKVDGSTATTKPKGNATTKISRKVTDDATKCRPASGCARRTDRFQNFGKTDPQVVSAYQTHPNLFRFPPTQIVYAQAEFGSFLCLIGSGEVKIACRHTDGREMVLNIVGVSQMVGHETLFDCGTGGFGSTTLTEVVCRGNQAIDSWSG